MMASSDHLTTLDPWALRPSSSFLDPWFSDAFSRDAETLTRALQMSFSSAAAAPTPSDSNTNTNNSSSDATNLTPDVVSPLLIPTPGLSGVTFGFDSFENTARLVDAPPPPKQKLRGVSSGKVTKRKPRPTKRSQTTFITADAASFRQMVQQVTGSRLGHIPTANIGHGHILRPEPHRPRNRFPGPSSDASLSSITGCLPTLDTSAFLLDRHRSQDYQQQGITEMVGRGSVASPPLPVALTDDFEPFFPMLDSWISM